MPGGRLFQAFDAYLNAYLNLIDTSEADHSEEAKKNVVVGQSAYDSYFAEKDPAIKMFSTYFGEKVSLQISKL